MASTVNLIYCFDIDGTLCTDTGGAYESAEPYPDRISHLNSLYAEGHTIKLFTARGSTTGIDWREATEAQLSAWGVRYHELILGKPHAHIFVDDKACGADTYRWSR